MNDTEWKDSDVKLLQHVASGWSTRRISEHTGRSHRHVAYPAQ